MDYKDYLVTKCDDIALDEYGVYFNDLDNEQQELVYKKAEDALADYYADQIDHARDMIKYGQVGQL